MSFKHGVIRSAFAAVAAASLLLVAAGPASAAGHSHSPNFAGVGLNASPSSGSVSFKLPALTCDETDSGIVPNLGFTNFDTQEFTAGGVYVRCVGGVAAYTTYEEINDAYNFTTATFAAGDTVKVSISATASGTTVTVADATNKASVSDRVKGAGGAGSFNGAALGDVTIGSPSEPVAPFTTLTFTGLKINGAAVPVGDAFTPSDLYNGSTLEISSGKLSAKGKLVTTFHHA